MATLAHWLTAMRLRTLPLALTTTLCGAWLAHRQQVFQWSIFLLTAATAMALQIFSNLANDYGDTLHGADRYRCPNAPPRMIATGCITLNTMRLALIANACICCLLGIILLSVAAINTWSIWLTLGALAIFAAFTYTAGSKPYGYDGWGDVAVFLFFGWLGVLGSETLYHGQLIGLSLLPASGVGCWCVMVLNLNNMRDYASDQQAGKRTLAVRLGTQRAKHYHAVLAIMALLCWLLFLGQSGIKYGFWWLLMSLFTAHHLYTVYRIQYTADFNRLLPYWSSTILLMIGLLWLYG